MHCDSPASLAGGTVPVSRHPLALVLAVSESLQFVVVPLGQMVAVALNSLNDQQGRIRDHSAEVVGHLFRETALEVIRAHGSSLIPCTGYFVAVTAVVFGLQMKKEAQRVNGYGPWDSELAVRTGFGIRRSAERFIFLC